MTDGNPKDPNRLKSVSNYRLKWDRPALIDSYLGFSHSSGQIFNTVESLSAEEFNYEDFL